MSRAGGSPTTPFVKRLAIIAVVLVVMILAASLVSSWVRLYALPVVVLVGVIYGPIRLALWVIEGPKKIIAFGVAVVFLALVGGCYADMVNKEDWKIGCHKDYYLWGWPIPTIV